MEFLYEKEARRYMLFLAAFWGLLVGTALFTAKWQAEGTKRVLMEREQEIRGRLEGMMPEYCAEAKAAGDEIRRIWKECH